MTRAPWVSHFGFTRTPFSKTIPASQLCDRASHQEAVARILEEQGEAYDGSGGPRRLDGTRIALGARIFAVVSRYAKSTADAAPGDEG